MYKKQHKKKLVNLKIDSINEFKEIDQGIYNDHEIGTLIEDIKMNGLREPIEVTFSAHGYRLLHGKRRMQACHFAGKKYIPAYIVRPEDVPKRRK